jgi:hypothetical protein
MSSSSLPTTNISYNNTIALLAATGIQIAFSFGLIVAFCLLRTSHKAVYEPKLKYAKFETRPPPLDRSYLGWTSVYSISEATEAEQIGLDGWLFTNCT